MESRKKILIVDDAEINVIVVNKLLKKNGFYSEVARNGLEAVEMIKSTNDFDLILMDIQMPVMDGYESTKSIRELGIETPVIALTATALDGDKDKIYNAGMNDYIVKPISQDLLFEKIEKYC